MQPNESLWQQKSEEGLGPAQGVELHTDTKHPSRNLSRTGTGTEIVEPLSKLMVPEGPKQV